MTITNFKKTIWLTAGLALFCLFQNCAKNYKIDTTGVSQSSVQDASASVLVTASRPNPPLDLFFIIDNSGSMLGHQINLGNAFASVFQSNSANLSNFDVNIYVFSTASTVNPSYINQIPTSLQSAITTIPLATDTAGLAAIPGSIFAIQNTAVGQYGVAPFSEQFNPAPVLDQDPSSGVITSVLHIPKKGNQSDSQYSAQIQMITQDFQSRLAFLNPTQQLNYEPLTDVSSGLCSVARILKHSSGFIQPGDSAAFVIVSDDNDRLNVRNPSGNQCTESISAAAEVIDGTCGHYETDIGYDSSASISYQTDTKFNYQSGTQINYSFPSGATCNFNYTKGYKYTSSYTALQTTVTYTKCNQMADGTCLSQGPGSQTIAGDYTSSGSACSQDMTSLVSSPIPGTTFHCSANNLTNQSGPSGVDAFSAGSQCSAQTISQLANGNRTNIVCTVTGPNTASGNVSGQPLGSCPGFCSANSQYANCALTSSSVSTTKGSIALAIDGVTCASQCPDSTKCGTGTVGSYITSTFGASAACNAPSAILSTIVVLAGGNSDGSALTCNSSLGGLKVTDNKGNQICSGSTSVQGCISSLQSGTPTSACAVAGGDHGSATAAIDMTCATACANSKGFCDPALYPTVAAFLMQTKNSVCQSASNGGVSKVTLKFNPNLAATANCTAKCSDTLLGSCDGKGWGALDGSTVADYVQKQLGGSNTCSASTRYVADGGSIAADAANPAGACTLSASPVFQATDTAHPGSVVTNYVAGDASHRAVDFQNFIISQASAVLGTNNLPAVAVITQIAGDNLQGTDVGTDYINLAHAMNSNQITSILSNYSQSLTAISNFIVQTTLNSFLLPIPPSSVVYSVSVVHQGSGVTTLLDSSQWSWVGDTLSLNSSANLKIGDEIVFQYHN